MEQAFGFACAISGSIEHFEKIGTVSTATAV
jgi:hypothetical protein